MSWGDCWGDSPGRSVEMLAKAFWEGRALKNSSGEVKVYSDAVEYYCRGREIAHHTPESMIPAVVAMKLEGRNTSVLPFEFRWFAGDRCEQRHLRALGVEAKWQWGGRPFLLFGADIKCWTTIEDAKAEPKWKEPVRRPRPERFVNLTYPLPFPEFA